MIPVAGFSQLFKLPSGSQTAPSAFGIQDVGLDLIVAHFLGNSGAGSVKERAGVLVSVGDQPRNFSDREGIDAAGNRPRNNGGSNQLAVNFHANREPMAANRLVMTVPFFNDFVGLIQCQRFDLHKRFIWVGAVGGCGSVPVRVKLESASMVFSFSFFHLSPESFAPSWRCGFHRAKFLNWTPRSVFAHGLSSGRK